MKRKFLSILLATVLSLSMLSACGSDGAQGDSDVNGSGSKAASGEVSSQETTDSKASSAVDNSSTANNSPAVDLSGVLPQVDILSYRMGVTLDTEALRVTPDECQSIFSNNPVWLSTNGLILNFGMDGNVITYSYGYSGMYEISQEPWIHDDDRNSVITSPDSSYNYEYRFFEKDGIVTLAHPNEFGTADGSEFYPSSDLFLFQRPEDGLTDIAGQWKEDDKIWTFSEDGTAIQSYEDNDYAYVTLDWFMPSEECIYIRDVGSGYSFWTKYNLTLTEDSATIVYPYKSEVTPLMTLTR